MNDLVRFLSQVGRLKDLDRAGWARRGIPSPESVADHSFRSSVLALVLGEELGVDRDRLLRIILVHDLAESDPTVGDVTPFDGVAPQDKHHRESAAMERLCATFPGGAELLLLWLEYDEGITPEARIAHQIDAVEMALQARDYENRHGLDLSEFRVGARQKVSHPTLLLLLDRLDGPVGPGENDSPSLV